jgi:hypothetical protein
MDVVEIDARGGHNCKARSTTEAKKYINIYGVHTHFGSRAGLGFVQALDEIGDSLLRSWVLAKKRNEDQQ